MKTETHPSPTTSPKDSTRPGAANFRRGLRWFLAEFIVVVAGILVAMSLNAWYQDRIDARNGLQYLALLSRDLQAMAQELDDRVRFEELQTQDAALLYRALSAPRLPADTLPLSMAVVHLSSAAPARTGVTIPVHVTVVMGFDTSPLFIPVSAAHSVMMALSPPL